MKGYDREMALPKEYYVFLIDFDHTAKIASKGGVGGLNVPYLISSWSRSRKKLNMSAVVHYIDGFSHVSDHEWTKNICWTIILQITENIYNLLFCSVKNLQPPPLNFLYMCRYCSSNTTHYIGWYQVNMYACRHWWSGEVCENLHLSPLQNKQ